MAATGDSKLQIVAGTYEGMLYGWEASTKDLTGKKPKSALKMVYGYPAHTECIKALAMMMEHDGKTLLTGGNDEMIKIYNVKKKVEVGILMQHKGAITCLEYYGKSHVLSGSADNTICIWRTSDWNCIHILGGHQGPVNSIAVHPSGKLAFSVSKDKTLRMWNLVKGRSAYIRRLDQEATCVFLSQDGNRYGLVMGNHVSIFGSANAELVGALEHKKKVHTAAFATNDLVVLGTDDGVLYLYRAQGQYDIPFMRLPRGLTVACWFVGSWPRFRTQTSPHASEVCKLWPRSMPASCRTSCS
ncbi:hypothetical protein, variant 4 [Aphanomyces astaci]|uniref:Uncharacterized protein n=1 Tax=Aphanomyces astaci TaxID=112090 RepID=W4HER7_APHAT|nr:hypothetical protein, variant 4 [Aphanomyces astaci]ETV89643.1 hypothetical protein, variant 4 [Aphanomyces astaci]|eukprot:XP_009822043.1 hypothetical protein, variant 4 [Aphanomyces astaci]